MRETPPGSAGGFTMVELAVALLMGSVLALVAGSLLFFFFSGWRTNRAAVELQRDGTVAVEFLDRSLRAAARNAVAVSGGQVTVAQSGGTEAFYAQGSDLMYDPDTSHSGNEIALVQGRLVSFSAERNAHAVSFQVVVEDGDQTAEIRGTVAPRN